MMLKTQVFPMVNGHVVTKTTRLGIELTATKGFRNAKYQPLRERDALTKQIQPKRRNFDLRW